VIAEARAQLSCSLCAADVLHGYDDLFHDVEDLLEIRHDFFELIGPSFTVGSEPARKPFKSLFE